MHYSSQTPGSAARRISVARARAALAALEREVTAALTTEPSAERLDHLITDAAGWRLILETERLRAKRRRTAALQDADDAVAREEADELSRRYDLITTELERLSAVIEDLKTRREELEPGWR
jgi:hypothetical protein